MKELGIVDGKKVYKVTISKGKLSADIISYGATITALRFNNNGKDVDVVLGFNDLEGYLSDGDYLGRTIGRTCNRIRDGKFILNGREYNLAKNNGTNCLHGGTKGFSHRVWDIEKLSGDTVSLTYNSLDMEEGYPGNLLVKVTYSINKDNAIEIEYEAVCDKDTIIGLTNHSFFNLNGQASGNALKHKLQINSKTIVPVDEKLCSYNVLQGVEKTVFDFTEFKEIGRDIFATDKLLACCGGYDVCYVFDDGVKLMASVIGDKSGIKMDVYSDQKGVQLYTSNFLAKKKGKVDNHDKYYGICLETQGLPNAINCNKFPSPILKKGDKYKTKTTYKFS